MLFSVDVQSHPDLRYLSFVKSCFFFKPTSHCVCDFTLYHITAEGIAPHHTMRGSLWCYGQRLWKMACHLACHLASQVFEHVQTFCWIADNHNRHCYDIRQTWCHCQQNLRTPPKHYSNSSEFATPIVTSWPSQGDQHMGQYSIHGLDNNKKRVINWIIHDSQWDWSLKIFEFGA